MHRDPQQIDTDEAAHRRVATRAWGLVLGVWIAFFAVLALVVVPMLFATCGVR